MSADAPTAVAIPASTKPAIVWGQPASASSKTPDVLAEERDKHRRRAERFGADYVEPGKVRKDLALEAKKERLSKTGFVTGFDPFSKEELDKRRDRASRFNIPEAPIPEYKPAEDIAAKARRAQKFGVEYEPSSAVLMDMDLYESRREVGLDAVRRRDTIHLYGVDVMSTDDVYKYFAEYGPTFVEWINDSSCNVVFGDEGSAKRAMIATGQPLPPAEGSATAGMDPSDMTNLPFLWHQGRDFEKDGTAVHLVYRMACKEDVKRPDAPKASRELWKAGQRGGGRSKGRRRVRGDEDVNGSGGGGGGGGGFDEGVELGDEDGAVEMKPARKRQRGGRKLRERMMRRQGGGDAEMADAEGVDGDGAVRSTHPLDRETGDLHPTHQQGSKLPAGSVDMGPPAVMMSVAATSSPAHGAGANE